jgi:hypothetical protein
MKVPSNLELRISKELVTRFQKEEEEKKIEDKDDQNR